MASLTEISLKSVRKRTQRTYACGVGRRTGAPKAPRTRTLYYRSTVRYYGKLKF